MEIKNPVRVSLDGNTATNPITLADEPEACLYIGGRCARTNREHLDARHEGRRPE